MKIKQIKISNFLLELRLSGVGYDILSESLEGIRIKVSYADREKIWTIASAHENLTVIEEGLMSGIFWIRMRNLTEKEQFFRQLPDDVNFSLVVEDDIAILMTRAELKFPGFEYTKSHDPITTLTTYVIQFQNN